jgi:hypothetical protein
MKLVCIFTVSVLCSCAQLDYINYNNKSPDRLLAIAQKKKNSRDLEPQYVGSIRPTVIFFHDITAILQKPDLSKKQKSRLVIAALKEFEKLAELDGAWTGEHASSGVDYLQIIIDSLGDNDFSQLLMREDFDRVRALLIWADVIKPNYYKTLAVLSNEPRQDFPLFSGYGFQVPAQWR